MAIRSLVLASLLAASTVAHAGPTTAAAAPASAITWTLTSAAGNVTGSLNEIAAFVASGNWSSSQAWSLFSSENTKAVAEMFAPSDALMMVGFNNGKAAPAAAAAGFSAGGGAAQTGGSGSGSAAVGGSASAGGSVFVGGNVGGGVVVGGTAGVGGSGNSAGQGNGPGAGSGPGNGAGNGLGGGSDAGGGAAAEIPEPGSIALLLAGLAGFGFMRRRQN